MNNNNKIAIIALRKVKLVGAVAIKDIWQQGLFDDSSYEEIVHKALVKLKKTVSETELKYYYEDTIELLNKSDEFGINAIDISDSLYPTQLRNLKNPPSILYYKGDITKANLTIGVIGTREPDQKGIEIAKRIGQYFINDGFSICNGLAAGIDEASINYHHYDKANVVGVVAGGLNYNRTKTLLKSTAEVVDKVLEKGGLVVSEYPYNTKEDTFKVVDSCSIQAGISHGMILIQSKVSGGSKYTIKSFAELNRPLGVVDVQGTKEDILYEANQLLLSNFKNGIMTITNLKENKIVIEKCFSIAQKDDYSVLANAIRKSTERENNPNTLF